MLIQFEQKFELPLEDVFSYFRYPGCWVKLYGEVAPTTLDGQGWYIIRLKKFPFPLKAKIVHFDEGRRVRWMFGGFWRGIADIEFRTGAPGQAGTKVVGYEYIIPFGFWGAEQLIGRLLMQKEFERIWELGWTRLHKLEIRSSAGR
jgi:hypothetical protein